MEHKISKICTILVKFQQNLCHVYEQHEKIYL
jgi:hypothetical protein